MCRASDKNKNIKSEYSTSGIKKALFVGLCTRDIVYYTNEIPSHNHKSKTEEFAVYIGGPAMILLCLTVISRKYPWIF